MKNCYKVLSFGLMWAACSMSQPLAAQQSDSLIMNLDQVLEVALSDNPDIQVANRTIEIKKYAKWETITGLFPSFSVTASATRNLEVATIVTSMGKFKMGQPYNYSLTGAVSVPLVAPQLWKSLQISKTSVELALEQARSSKISTISAVKKAFFQLLLARDSYDVLRTSYDLAEENLALTRNKYKLDLVAEYDTLTAYVQKVSLEPDMLSMKNTINLAEMQLKVLMGVDVNEPIRFEGHLKDYEEKLFSDLMILKEKNTLDDNSTLRQMDIQSRQLVLTEKINKLGYIPTLAFQIQGGWSSMPAKFNPFEAAYYGSASMSLAFSWTINGASFLKTRQNKLSIENLEEQRKYAVEQLELAINSSLNSIETAAEQVVANKQSIYASERAYQISAKRYDVGSGTQLEVNNSATKLQQTNLQYVQAIYNFVTARANIEETLGRTVTDK